MRTSILGEPEKSEDELTEDRIILPYNEDRSKSYLLGEYSYTIGGRLLAFSRWVLDNMICRGLLIGCLFLIFNSLALQNAGFLAKQWGDIFSGEFDELEKMEWANNAISKGLISLQEGWFIISGSHPYLEEHRKNTNNDYRYSPDDYTYIGGNVSVMKNLVSDKTVFYRNDCESETCSTSPLSSDMDDAISLCAEFSARLPTRQEVRSFGSKQARGFGEWTTQVSANDSDDYLIISKKGIALTLPLKSGYYMDADDKSPAVSFRCVIDIPTTWRDLK